MRLTHFLLASTVAFVPLVTACGGGSVGASDAAAALPDAALPDAALPDAAPGTSDASSNVDAGAGAASRLWVAGDIAADTRGQVQVFDDTLTLPATPVAAVPGGAADKLQAIGSGTSTSFPFSVSADGGTIAYAADSTVAGRFDLYVASATGGAPTLLVPGTTNVEFSAIELSPNGNRLAYVADATLDGQLDIFVVATAATSTSVNVTPTRTTAGDVALDVFPAISWSADSTHFAFSASPHVTDVSEVFAVDVSVSTPVATTLLSNTDIGAGNTTGGGTTIKGIRGVPQFDAANNVYFRAITKDATGFHFFKVAANGTGRAALNLAPARTDASVPEYGAFEIAPDGTHVAFSADAPVATAYEIYVAPLDGSSAASRRTTGTAVGGAPDFLLRMAFSPEGSKLAFVGDTTTVGIHEPYVVTASGTVIQTRLVTLAGNQDAKSGLVWTANGAAVYARGDLLVDNEENVFRLDPAAANQTPVAALTAVASGDVTGVVLRAP